MVRMPTAILSLQQISHNSALCYMINGVMIMETWKESKIMPPLKKIHKNIAIMHMYKLQLYTSESPEVMQVMHRCMASKECSK